MQARMSNIAIIVPDTMRALHALHESANKGGVPSQTLGLLQLCARARSMDVASALFYLHHATCIILA